MNDRTCIVTRKTAETDELIRFVVGPDSAVVPDLKRNLPGRGCWVSADRLHVDKAAAKNLFSRAFKTKVDVPAELGALVDGLLARSAARRERSYLAPPRLRQRCAAVRRCLFFMPKKPLRMA
jgi:predicted RNA-binding protein YlxR (DUF448 family)